MKAETVAARAVASAETIAADALAQASEPAEALTALALALVIVARKTGRDASAHSVYKGCCDGLHALIFGALPS